MQEKPANAKVIELSRYEDRRRASTGEAAGGEIVLFTGVRYERIEAQDRAPLREAL